MQNKILLSKKWGPYWPHIGEEHITPILEAYGFAFQSKDVEDGLICWKKNDVSNLFHFEINVNPNKVDTPRHCGFAGIFSVRCAAAGQLQVDSNLLFVPLAWMVRHGGIYPERYFWQIGYDEPQASLKTFTTDMAQHLSPLLTQLQSMQAVIDFILNIDTYSAGLKGGPAFRPAELLKISALCFVSRDIEKARYFLEQYYPIERANLHRLWGLPNEKSKLDHELGQLETVVRNLRLRFGN
jgi:hypothetical protein